MMRREIKVRLGGIGLALAGLLLAREAHAQPTVPRPVVTPATAPAPAAAPAPAPTAAPAPTTAEAAPVYAPPPAPTETLPATPAPTPYAGPPAPPTNAYPTPSTPGAPASPATPAAGMDFGGQSMTPLPPPPAAKDPSRIRLQPWRGRYWLGFRMLFTGPLGGEVPARPNLLTLGGGADFGVRLGNVLGLGMGLSGHIQNRVITTVEGVNGNEKATFTGRMLNWDALFVRVHAPLKRRFQPYLEAGGGLARLVRAEGGDKLFGAQLRLGLGLEGWVSRSVTLGVAGTYRLNALNDRMAGRWIVGHAMQGVVELGFHW